MVVRNKLYRIIDKYRNKLRSRTLGRVDLRHKTMALRGIRTKNRVLDFYLKNKRWPSRLSSNKNEKRLGYRFENFLSKQSHTYDPQLRRIAMATGRTTNHKRKHDVKGFKKEILQFMETHGRAPMPRRHQTVEGEGCLREKLNRYTLELKDMTFLGEVYGKDKCHRSGIPGKYRKLINESLDVEKPLIRLVKE